MKTNIKREKLLARDFSRYYTSMYTAGIILERIGPLRYRAEIGNPKGIPHVSRLKHREDLPLLHRQKK